MPISKQVVHSCCCKEDVIIVLANKGKSTTHATRATPRKGEEGRKGREEGMRRGVCLQAHISSLTKNGEKRQYDSCHHAAMEKRGARDEKGWERVSMLTG